MNRLLDGAANFFTSLTPRGWVIGAGAILFVIAVGMGLYFSGKRKGENVVKVATEAGESKAVATGQAQTLDQLKDAKDAEQTLRSSGVRSAARYEQCLLDSDRREACERYRPEPRSE